MPLDIIIIGAGPAGLAAAIYLSRAKHNVRIYEKASPSLLEGWTLVMHPPGRQLLEDLGVPSELFSPIDWAVYRDIRSGKEMLRFDLKSTQERLKTRYRTSTIDRSDLQDSLRHILSLEKVQVNWGVKITDVDVKGKVFFNDGHSDTADLVIGADGIHSLAFKSFPTLVDDPKYVLKPVRLPVIKINCVTDIVEAEAAADPELSKFLQEIEVAKTLTLFSTAGPPKKDGPLYGPGAMNWICLPSRHGALLNIAPIEDDPRAADFQGPWTISINQDEFCNYAKIDIAVKPLQTSLSKFSRNFERWTLGYRDCPLTFVQGRIALIGDAAHPQHPNDGAGASVAVEDAAGLATLLTDAKPEDISHRLMLYDRLRYTRDLQEKYIGDYARPPGTGTSAEMYEKLVPHCALPAKSEVTDMLWTDDPINNAKKMLEEELGVPATEPTWKSRILGLVCT